MHPYLVDVLPRCCLALADPEGVMSIVARVEGSGPTVVTLAGELDIATAPELRDCLASIDGDIELDCSRLEFVDAAGLGVFVSAHRRCDGQGWKFVLVEPSAFLLRLLDTTGLDARIHVRSDAASPG